MSVKKDSRFYWLAGVVCGYLCSGIYSGPLMPQLFNTQQIAANSNMRAVIFCIYFKVSAE
jgi:hypothetical protein